MKKSLKILAILSICSYFFLTSCVVSKKLLIAVEKERDTCQANMRQCQENFQYLEDQLDVMTSKVIKGERDLYEMTILKNSLQVKNDTLERIVVQLRGDSVKIAQQLDTASNKMFEMGQFIDSLFFYSKKLEDTLNILRDSLNFYYQTEEQTEDLQTDDLLPQKFTGKSKSESDVRTTKSRKNVVLVSPNNSQKTRNTGVKKTVIKKPVNKKPVPRKRIIKKK